MPLGIGRAQRLGDGIHKHQTPLDRLHISVAYKVMVNKETRISTDVECDETTAHTTEYGLALGSTAIQADLRKSM